MLIFYASNFIYTKIKKNSIISIGEVNKPIYERMDDDMKIMCNACGRELKNENGILKEDAFEATKEWGYFSKKDLEVHKFVICEDCYDKMAEGFAIPVQRENKREAM